MSSCSYQYPTAFGEYTSWKQLKNIYTSSPVHTTALFIFFPDPRMTLTGCGDRHVPLDTTLSAVTSLYPVAFLNCCLFKSAGARHTLGMKQHDWFILRTHLHSQESDWTVRQHTAEVTEPSQLIFTSIRSWQQLQVVDQSCHATLHCVSDLRQSESLGLGQKAVRTREAVRS